MFVLLLLVIAVGVCVVLEARRERLEPETIVEIEERRENWDFPPKWRPAHRYVGPKRDRLP